MSHDAINKMYSSMQTHDVLFSFPQTDLYCDWLIKHILSQSQQSSELRVIKRLISFKIF